LYRFTPAAWVSIALTLFAVALALAFLNHLLVYTAVFFATGNLGLFIWSILSTRGLTVEREHPSTCLRGYPLTITLRIRNRGRGARFALIGYDCFLPAGHDKAYREIAVLSLAAGSSAEASYQATPRRRGIFEIGPFYFYSGDPFGFYRHVRRVDALTQLAVLPTPLNTRVNYLHSTSQVRKDELATIAMPGYSSEFLGVREYADGDPLRKIHWASTARLGKLITKQFERNVASTLCVLLVNDERSGTGKEEEHTPLEYSITLISTLAREASRANYLFSFLEINGKDIRAASGTGDNFFQTLALQLAEIGPGHPLDLQEHTQEIFEYLKPGSDLIIFTPHLTGTQAKFLANLRLQYRLLSVITFDLGSFRTSMPARERRSRVSFGKNFIIFELAYGDDLERQLQRFVEKVGFVR